MVDGPIISETAAALTLANTVIKQYPGLLSPAAEEVGRLLAIPFRVVRRAAELGEEQWVRLLTNVAEKLRDVPPEKRLPPPPPVAAPTIDHYPFVADEPSLRDLFENLLASSMNQDLQTAVHPAFAQVLKELGPEDAKLLKMIHAADTTRIAALEMRVYTPEGGYHPIGHTIHLSDEFDRVALDNLVRLGIVRFVDKRLRDQKVYEELAQIDNDLLQKVRLHVAKDGELKLSPMYMEVTTFGVAFLRACIGDASPPPPGASPQNPPEPAASP